MKKTKQIISGTLTAVLAWVILIIADVIDEYVLDMDSYLGFLLYIILPTIMLICYVIINIRCKPAKEKIVVWHIAYSVVCGVIWYVIYRFSEEDIFVFNQKDRSSFLNLNGIEYIFFGFSIILVFTVLCMLFHFIMFIIKMIKKSKR